MFNTVCQTTSIVIGELRQSHQISPPSRQNHRKISYSIEYPAISCMEDDLPHLQKQTPDHTWQYSVDQ